MANKRLKHGLWEAEMPPFGGRKTAFCNPKGIMLIINGLPVGSHGTVFL